MSSRDKSDTNKDPLPASRGSLLGSVYSGHLSEESIDEFTELYKKHYGVVLDREVAVEKAATLCRLVELVDFNSTNT